MVKPEELRIGNIINKGVVQGIDDVHGVITDQEYDIKFEDCEPIPLTEDWMPRMGFNNTAIKWKDGSVSQSVWQLEGKYTIEFTREGIAFFLFFGIRHDPVFIKHVPYVHDLQNAMFVFLGAELTIK